ncbi:SDR family NAD(P)-dependent oxidoreductase, partial [Lonsdalea populi]
MSRSVLVTGASKGIGQAIALSLAADGFTVAVHYHRDREGAEQTLRQMVESGGQGRIIGFDIADREQCRTEIEQDIER